jgi:hypothetical protein
LGPDPGKLATGIFLTVSDRPLRHRSRRQEVFKVLPKEEEATVDGLAYNEKKV